MASSPESTVSSDLYPPSEPSRVEDHCHLEQEDSRDGQPQISTQYTRPDLPESEYSDTMQGFESSDDDGSRHSSTITLPTSNDILPDSSRKRKRDHGLEPNNTSSQGYNPNKGVRNINGSDSSNFKSKSLCSADTRSSSAFEATTKRTKTGDHTLKRDIGAHLFSKSSALPAVLWQHILCYVPPVFLGCLLRVNHAFNSYLTPGRIAEAPRELLNSRIQPLNAEEIWAASRKRFAPGLPRPIHGFKELDMWRLLRGQDCQLCHKTKVETPAAEMDSAWNLGPGSSGVRVVWPFRIRTCGECLQKETRKEVDLYLSSDYPSFLLPALPFAFVSDTKHYIGHSQLRNAPVSPTPYPNKCYYKPHLDDIKRQSEEAKELGAASAEEWMKGLAGQGQRRLEDAIRWEQWESKGGLKKLNMPRQLRAGSLVPAFCKTNNVKSDTRSNRSTPLSMAFPTKHEVSLVGQVPLPPMILGHFVSGTSTPPLPQSWNSHAPPLSSNQQPSRVSSHNPRPERTIQNVIEAKAARRAEIERRCAALETPLLPNILNHMESFQAAMQITQPMTDQAWQVLKPRLLSQLSFAERKEKERLQQVEVLEEKYKEQRQLESRLKETKENSDREWESFQTPIRNRLGAIADEVIENRWSGARNLSKETCPKFAADVLLDVRQRFCEDIGHEDNAARAAGDPIKIDPPNGPPPRTLILENMKWVFDTKIKPLTDHFQREIFLCNGCDGNFKFYGFEGVVQHYAAKHTSELSRGNVVVNWRAEWPEEPPFSPNPSFVKAAYYSVPTPATPIPISTSRDFQGVRAYGHYGPSSIVQVHNGPHYPASTFLPSYFEPQHQAPYPLPTQIYPSSQSTYAPNPTSYSATQSESKSQYSQHPNRQQFSVPQAYNSSYPGFFPHSGASNPQPVPARQGCLPAFNGSGGNILKQPNVRNGHLPHPSPLPPTQAPDYDQWQMDEMAKHAKDVFMGIGGVKDLPGSVRIFVVIQHTVSRFKAAFPNEPSLAMFIDGLDHNSIMRPVRSVNGLGCKTCIRSGTSAKLYTLPHLVNHFRSTHAEHALGYGHTEDQPLDWKSDMIDLPETRVISDLANASGMTDGKLSLIAWAFPEVFSSSSPVDRNRLDGGNLPIYRNGIEFSSSTDPMAMSDVTKNIRSQFQYASNDDYYSRPGSGLRALSESNLSEPVEPPREDEYDPHRPAYLGRIVNIEPMSDQARKPIQASAPQKARQSSFQPSHRVEPNRNNVSTNDHHLNDAFTSRNSLNERDPTKVQDLSQSTQQPQPQKRSLTSRSDIRPEVRANDRAQRQIYLDKQESPVDYDRHYRHRSEFGNQDDNSRPPTRDLSNGYPPEATAAAADQFLRDIPSSRNQILDHQPYATDRKMQKYTKALLEVEPLPGAQPDNLEDDDASDQRRVPGPHEHRQYRIETAEHPWTRSSDPRNGDTRIFYRRPRSPSPYIDSKRSSSHLHIPLKPVRSDDDSIVHYVPYESTVSASNHYREDLGESTSKRSLSGSLPYQTTRLSQFRDGPVAHDRSSPETALYRPQSPVEEDRSEPKYRLRSPPRHRQEISQRIIDYDNAAETRYEYIDDCRPQHDNRSRVQYIRYEDLDPRESSRYVVARPIERVSPQYISYERSYAKEPVNETSDSILHDPIRIYQDLSARADHPLPQGYEA